MIPDSPRHSLYRVSGGGILVSVYKGKHGFGGR